MNIIASEKGQGVYMIPKQSLSGVSYGDYLSYAEKGQQCMFGGQSDYGSYSGLACLESSAPWTYTFFDYSSRLAYYGPLNRVTTSRFKQLAS